MPKVHSWSILVLSLFAILLGLVAIACGTEPDPLLEGVPTPSLAQSSVILIAPPPEYAQTLARARLARDQKLIRENEEREKRHEIIEEMRNSFQEMVELLGDLEPSKVVPYPNNLSDSREELTVLMEMNAQLYGDLNSAAEEELSRSPFLGDLLSGSPTPTVSELPSIKNSRSRSSSGASQETIAQESDSIELEMDGIPSKSKLPLLVVQAQPSPVRTNSFGHVINPVPTWCSEPTTGTSSDKKEASSKVETYVKKPEKLVKGFKKMKW